MNAHNPTYLLGYVVVTKNQHIGSLKSAKNHLNFLEAS